ncbi:hypothetical protein M6B38_269070 [Iris pallida]|uniref:Uncharacterized protein n=1 Tax=Iris pallida TaxID=29817 RepID=A0AAX6IB18_IRIPA|nr:hypothetical protein M6B38_269070 [Iris pallida]
MAARVSFLLIRVSETDLNAQVHHLRRRLCEARLGKRRSLSDNKIRSSFILPGGTPFLDDEERRQRLGDPSPATTTLRSTSPQRAGNFFSTTDRDNILVIEHTKSSNNRRARRERVRHLEGLTALWIRSTSQDLVV